MIKVRYTKNTITLNGHANFANYGKDIVCSSVSSIVTTSINDMHVVNKDAIVYEDDGQEMIIKIVKEDELILKLFDNLVQLLLSIAHDYPENIKVESEE